MTDKDLHQLTLMNDAIVELRNQITQARDEGILLKQTVSGNSLINRTVSGQYVDLHFLKPLDLMLGRLKAANKDLEYVRRSIQEAINAENPSTI